MLLAVQVFGGRRPVAVMVLVMALVVPHCAIVRGLRLLPLSCGRGVNYMPRHRRGRHNAHKLAIGQALVKHFGLRSACASENGQSSKSCDHQFFHSGSPQQVTHTFAT